MTYGIRRCRWPAIQTDTLFFYRCITAEVLLNRRYQSINRSIRFRSATIDTSSMNFLNIKKLLSAFGES